MNPISAWMKRHPLAAFFVLAYALSWWGWVVGTLYPASRPFVPYPFVAAGPLLAALGVTSITAGWPGVRALVARLLQWRVGWRWYVVALGLPLTVALGAVALNVRLGAPAPSLAQLGPCSMPLLVFALRLINPLDGPMGEELGWRGYALPRLQARRSPLVASLILGLLAAGWHLPLVLAAGASPFELLAPIALTVAAIWVYNRTGGSVWMTLVLHAADGVIQIEALGFVGVDAARMVWLYAALWWVAAIGVVILDPHAWRTHDVSAPASGRIAPTIGR